MWNFFKRLTPLTKAVQEYRTPDKPNVRVLAMEATYLPHGGTEVFWFHDRREHFEGHAVHYEAGGGIRVRTCTVDAANLEARMAEANFFDLKNPKSECADGLCYSICFCNGKTMHEVSARHVFNPEIPQTKLFVALSSLFPAREQ